MMKLSALTSLLLGASYCCTHAFVAPQPTSTAAAFLASSTVTSSPSTTTTTECQMVAAPQVAFDQEQYIAESKEMRLKHLEEQAMFALKIAVENYG
jgi:hypothetical protein